MRPIFFFFLLLFSFFIFYFFYYTWYSSLYFPKSKNPQISFLVEKESEENNDKDFKIETLSLQKERGTVSLIFPKNADLNHLPVILILRGLSSSPSLESIEGAFYLAKKGNIVVLPEYQTSIFDPFSASGLVNRASVLTKEGLSEIKKLAPQNNFSHFAIIGYSLGGAVATNLIHFDLPSPKALILIVPTETFPLVPPSLYGVPLTSLSPLSSDTILVGIFTHRDRLASFSKTVRIFQNATHLQQKYTFKILSDTHGFPPLIINHATIFIKPNLVNLRGTFKLVEISLKCAFEKKNCSLLSDDKEELLSLGKWSDGKEARIIEKIPVK